MGGIAWEEKTWGSAWIYDYTEGCGFVPSNTDALSESC